MSNGGPSQKSGLHPNGIMQNGLGDGQDGFSGIADRVSSFKDGDCTLQVGRDEATAVDSRGKPGTPPGVKQSY